MDFLVVNSIKDLLMLEREFLLHSFNREDVIEQVEELLGDVRSALIVLVSLSKLAFLYLLIIPVRVFMNSVV